MVGSEDCVCISTATPRLHRICGRCRRRYKNAICLNHLTFTLKIIAKKTNVLWEQHAYSQLTLLKPFCPRRRRFTLASLYVCCLIRKSKIHCRIFARFIYAGYKQFSSSYVVTIVLEVYATVDSYTYPLTLESYL